MGLTSLWSSITGPRIKEITPKAKWLEKNGPTSSSASIRTSKSAGLLRFRTGIIVDSRPESANTDKRTRKKPRSLSISKTKPGTQPTSQTTSRERRENAEKKMPDVPALPSTFSPESKHIVSPTLSEETVRPGVAITTDASVSTEVFELPADTLPSPPLPSPSSLPLSFTNPKYTSESPCDEGRGSRKRSNSTASGTPRRKRASWFRGSTRNAAELELPPPLPPPTSAPPKPPIIELPADERRLSCRLSMARRASSGSTVPRTSTSCLNKNSLDSDSVLEAFPSVPGPTKDGARTPDFSVPRTGLRGVNTTTITAGGDMAKRISTSSARSPRFITRINTIDGILKHTANSNEKPKRDSKQSLRVQVDDERASLSFIEELQREYDKVSQMMDLMDRKETNETGESVRNSKVRTSTMEQAQKFSNEEALAALEFDLK